MMRSWSRRVPETREANLNEIGRVEKRESESLYGELGEKGALVPQKTTCLSAHTVSLFSLRSMTTKPPFSGLSVSSKSAIEYWNHRITS